MKNKSIFLILLMLLCTSAFAAEENKELSSGEIRSHFPYFSLGAMFVPPCPEGIATLGAGYQFQRNHHGMDAALNGGIMLGHRVKEVVPAFKGNLLYHYYFKPNLRLQPYFGLGPSFYLLVIYKRPCFQSGFDACFGLQWKRKAKRTHFLEIEASLLFENLCPAVGCKYGFSF